MGRIGSSSPAAQMPVQPSRLTAGAAIPRDMGTTSGNQVRITPQNYREVLGANADVLLTPSDMKSLYENGHLDVQRHMQTAESNEGFITLASKLAAALVGPSRSVGAISIDPLFLEMIKDPNAEIGAGYTRIRNESITVLPSPAAPPAPERPERPQVTQGATPLSPTEQDTRIREQKEVILEQDEYQPVKINPPPTDTVGQEIYAVTITEDWQNAELHGRDHKNSVQSSSMQQMMGNANYNYNIYNAYVDPTVMPSGATVAERNGRETANTVATIQNRDGYELTGDAQLADHNKFIGKEIMCHRMYGNHPEYNDKYHFMTMGHLAAINVKGDSHQTENYANLAVADFKRQNPDADQAQLDTVKTAAEQAVAAASPPITAADVYTLQSKNTTIGSGPETTELRSMYNQLLGDLNPPVGPLSDEQFNQVSMTDFYAVQYNAAAAASGKGIPQLSFTVGANGQVSGLDAGEINATNNLRLAAETNFGRRVGESLVVTPQANNDLVRRQNPGQTDAQLGNKLLTQDDAANVNVNIDDLSNSLETLGLGFSDSDADHTISGQATLKNKDGKEATMVPNGADNSVRRTVQAAINKLSSAEQQQYAGLISSFNATPSSVPIAEMKEVLDLAKSRGASVGPRTYERLTNPVQINSFTASEWNGLLTGENSIMAESGATAIQQAKDGQFVSVVGGTTASQPALASNINANIQTLSQPGVLTSETGPAENLGQFKELGDQIQGLSNPAEHSVTVNGNSYTLDQWGTEEQPGPLQDAVKAQAQRPHSSPTTAVTNIGRLAEPGVVSSATDSDLAHFNTVDSQVGSLSEEQLNTPVPNFELKLADGTTRPAVLKDWSSPPEGAKVVDSKGVEHPSLRAAVLAVASTEVLSSGGPTIETKAQDAVNNLHTLGQEHAGGTRIMPGSADRFRASVNPTIEALKGMDPNAEINVQLPGVEGTSHKVSDVLTHLTTQRDGLLGSGAEDSLGAVDIKETEVARQGVAPSDLNQNFDQFHDYLRGAIADGKITTTEKAEIQGFVDDATLSLANQLKTAGHPDFQSFDASNKTALQAAIGQVTPQQLQGLVKPGGLSEGDKDKLVTNIGRLQSAQVSVNLSSEGQSTSSLYQSMRNLNQRLDKFDAEEVVKTAFRGEMQKLAKDNPEGFQNLMAVTYSLPPLQPGDTTSAAAQEYQKLTDLAAAGNIPVPPNVELVSRESIGGANGAYSPDNGGTIVLASDLISRDNDGKVSMSQKGMDVFAEEMFHHLETQVEIQTLLGSDPANQDSDGNINAPNNGGNIDAVGDEGRAGLSALRALRQDSQIAQDQLSDIAVQARQETANVGQGITRNEDSRDQGTLNANLQVDGRTVLGAGATLEFSTDAAGAGAVTGGNASVQNNPTTNGTDPNPDAWNTPGIRPHQGQPMGELHDSGSFTNPTSFNENFPDVARLDAAPDAEHVAEEPGLGAKIGGFGAAVASGLGPLLHEMGGLFFDLSDKMKQVIQKHWGGINNSNLAGSEATESATLSAMGMKLKGSDSLNDKHIRNLKFQNYNTLAPQYQAVQNQNRQAQAAYRRDLETAGASDEIKQKAAQAAQERAKQNSRPDQGIDGLDVNGTLRPANWQTNGFG